MDGWRLPVTPEPQQRSRTGWRKLQPPAQAPGPLAEAAVRSREGPPTQTGLRCGLSCRCFSPAGPLHPPRPPSLREQHVNTQAGRAERAGTPSTQSPGRAISPTQTRASGAGRHPLQGRAPISSAWAHLSLLCPSPHPRDSSAGGHMEVEVKETQLGSGGASRPARPREHSASGAQCVLQLCRHPHPAPVPPGPLQSSTVREPTSGPGRRAGLADDIPKCQGPGVQRIISLGPVLAHAHPHTPPSQPLSPRGLEQERGCSRVTLSDPGGHPTGMFRDPLSPCIPHVTHIYPKQVGPTAEPRTLQLGSFWFGPHFTGGKTD